MSSMAHKIEKALYVRGFTSAPVRKLMRNQILVLLGSVCLLGLVPWAGVWPAYFVVGALLVTYNLYALARFVQQLVLETFTREMLFGLLFRSWGRLLLTGLTLFVLIRWGQASVPALVAGLSTVAATITVWGLAQRFEQNVKEA